MLCFYFIFFFEKPRKWNTAKIDAGGALSAVNPYQKRTVPIKPDHVLTKLLKIRINIEYANVITNASETV